MAIGVESCPTYFWGFVGKTLAVGAYALKHMLWSGFGVAVVSWFADRSWVNGR